MVVVTSVVLVVTDSGVVRVGGGKKGRDVEDRRREMMDDGKIESRARLAGLERREEGGTGLDGLGAVRWSEKEADGGSGVVLQVAGNTIEVRVGSGPS